MKNRLNRRSFLRRTSLATAGGLALPPLIPASVLGAVGGVPANSRIQVGCIGTGPQGRGVMGNFLNRKECRVVAVCDVKTDSLGRARDQVNKAYGDDACAATGEYRDLLDRRDIDVVLIATPDHWHVPLAVAAAQAGKDMYVEKPLGLTVEEDQILRRTLQREKRVFQFGTQQRSSRQFWQACQLVRGGHIGELKQINVWAPASRPGGTTQPATPPPTINYDRWLGPAPYTPYTEEKCLEDWGKTWWYTYDYALGFIAGWGIHPLDIALWGCDSLVKGPLTVEGRAIIPTEGACNTAVAWQVEYRCADGVGLTFKSSSSGYKEPTEMTNLKPWAARYGRDDGHGTAFEGTRGWVMVDRSGIRTQPETLVEVPLGVGDSRLLRSDHHVRNLLEAVKTRGPTVSPIEAAVQGDVLCHLADIATRLERPLRWDPSRERFLGDAEANRRLALRKMRKPWTL